MYLFSFHFLYNMQKYSFFYVRKKHRNVGLTCLAFINQQTEKQGLSYQPQMRTKTLLNSQFADHCCLQ